MFLVVAETLHIANAADRLRLTSSRVSQVLNRLERRIGGRLLERTTRTVALTPLGEQLRTSSGAAIAMLDRAVAEARAVAVGLQGVLTIGCYSLVAFSPALRHAVDRFEGLHPAASVAVADAGSAMGAFEMLRRSECDVVVSRLPMDDRDIVVGPVFDSEPRVALMARNHPLTVHDDLVYEQLADYPVTDSPFTPRAIMDAFIPPRTPSGRLLSRKVCASLGDILRAAGAQRLVHPTVPSVLAALRDDDAEFDARPITDLPPSEMALMWLVRRDADPLIAAFAELAARLHAGTDRDRADESRGDASG